MIEYIIECEFNNDISEYEATYSDLNQAIEMCFKFLYDDLYNDGCIGRIEYSIYAAHTDSTDDEFVKVYTTRGVNHVVIHDEIFAVPTDTKIRKIMYNTNKLKF